MQQNVILNNGLRAFTHKNLGGKSCSTKNLSERNFYAKSSSNKTFVPQSFLSKSLQNLGKNLTNRAYASFLDKMPAKSLADKNLISKGLSSKNLLAKNLGTALLALFLISVTNAMSNEFIRGGAVLKKSLLMEHLAT